MASAADPCNRRANQRIAASLLLAAILHMPLLWLPAPQNALAPQVPQHLIVTLQHSEAPGEVFAAEEPKPPPTPAATPVRQRGPVTTETNMSDVRPKHMPGSSFEKPTPPSAARLLDLAGQRGWDHAKPSAPLRLGEPASQSIHENGWPRIQRKSGRFDEVSVREKVGIVDRWLAADGSHNVVMTTLTGETYCGRSEAWSPLNPLFEPITMWRPCGGDGNRTFDWPRRYRKTAIVSDQP